jgi:hypothetical protein
MADQITIRQGDATTTVENVKVVNIFVERDSSGKPTRIDHPGDVHIHCTKFGVQPNPNLPREVLWVSSLLPGEEMHFEAKEDQEPRFNWNAFVLDDKHRMVSTGPVLAPYNDQQTWSYGIRLLSPKLRNPLLIDPTIIIDPEP